MQYRGSILTSNVSLLKTKINIQPAQLWEGVKIIVVCWEKILVYKQILFYALLSQNIVIDNESITSIDTTLLMFYNIISVVRGKRVFNIAVKLQWFWIFDGLNVIG